MITLFEEYRYLRIGDDDNNVNKDPEEPFFSGPKKKYLARKKEEREEARRIEFQERRDQVYIEGVEKSKRQEPLVKKYVDILTNNPERIQKTKFHSEKTGLWDNNNFYGVKIDDGAVIITVWNGEKYPGSLKINGEQISFTKEKKTNKSVDAYGEENWEEDEISYPNILCDLVKNHVSKNEIIW